MILGSASPRRHELLTSLDVQFTVVAADVDEERLAQGLDAHDAVIALALAKAAAIRDSVGPTAEPILTADTLVVGPTGLVGKPESAAHTEALLAGYSNNSIEVVTGVALSTDVGVDTRLVSTTVHFREISPEACRAYASSGAGDDKAGALELQGAAKPFISRVDGCWTNVVGLPLCAVLYLLGQPGRGLCGTHRHCDWCPPVRSGEFN